MPKYFLDFLAEGFAVISSQSSSLLFDSLKSFKIKHQTVMMCDLRSLSKNEEQRIKPFNDSTAC